MALLARREHSVRELERKLNAKAFAAEAVSAVLDELRSEGLQSDLRFAESFTAMRVAKGCGPVRIRAELRERGVDEDLIEEQLRAMSGEWLAMAAQVRRKRFGAALPSDIREQARQARFLNYRGFAAEQVRALLQGNEED